MKIRTSLLLILLSLMISNLTLSCRKTYKPVPDLSEFVMHDKYGDLYEELTSNRGKYNETYLLFYDIILKSVINKPVLSNHLIEKFRTQFTTSNDTVNYYLTQTEYNNYVKLCDYRKLREIGGTLIEKYQAFVDSSDYIELKDDNLRYGILENEKPIELNKLADTRVKIRKDLAGYILLNLKSSNDSTVDFIFDTGANVNTITESAAVKMNIRAIPNSTIHVMGATGARNEAHIGIADKITLNNIEMHNVEFVIFADSLFTFAGGMYVINGTVGFPIFSRFEEITYTDSTLFVPRTPVLGTGEPDMFIKLDDYILSIGYKGRKYPFFFDTGNMRSYLMSEFYKIDTASFKPLKDTVLAYAGLGGSTTLKAKQPAEVILNFAGKDFRLIRPFVETESEHRNTFMYGSIGKDFMGMYKTRIMSFKESRIEFE
jgi:predicted aspartyl protease